MIGRDALLAELNNRFPELAGELADETWAGLLHLEVGCFARYTQEQIEARNVERLRECYECARRFFVQGDEPVKNAIYVSYLENLNFEDGKRERAWAKAALPAELQRAYRELLEYMARLSRAGGAPPSA
jgi:hypothetical protein